MKTTISIIVPCYNQSQYLDEALDSVLNQTYQDWECIIVNDGSLDATETVAQEWLDKDSRFKYVYKKNGGLSSARNAGIEKATGEFILPLDADDRIGADYLQMAIVEFEKEDDLKVVYCKAEKFGYENGLWKLQPFSLEALANSNMIFCSAIYRKYDWKRVEGYDSKMIYGFEDWEFWIAILKNGGRVKCLDSIGFYYRIKPDSMVHMLNKEKNKILHEYLSIKHAGFFVAQLGSFIHLKLIAERSKTEWVHKLNNKKFVLDVFCSTFFGFSIFKKYKKN